MWQILDWHWLLIPFSFFIFYGSWVRPTRSSSGCPEGSKKLGTLVIVAGKVFLFWLDILNLKESGGLFEVLFVHDTLDVETWGRGQKNKAGVVLKYHVSTVLVIPRFRRTYWPAWREPAARLVVKLFFWRSSRGTLPTSKIASRMMLHDPFFISGNVF